MPASPEEQQDLHQLMVKAGTMIHGRASRDAVLDSLHQPNLTVAQSVGHTAASILMAINDQKKATTQQPIDNDVLNEAAKHLIPELMDLGISAGIFPIKPPAGDNLQPGVGSDPYNKTMRMALLEATKVYGESLLRQPNAPQLTEAAGNMWALGVRQEMANGTADPKYKAMVQQKGAGAPSPSLMPPAGGAAPPPAGAPPGGAPSGQPP